jgi:hypothetical protein
VGPCESNLETFLAVITCLILGDMGCVMMCCAAGFFRDEEGGEEGQEGKERKARYCACFLIQKPPHQWIMDADLVSSCVKYTEYIRALA